MKFVLYLIFAFLFLQIESQPDQYGRFCKIPCLQGTQCINGLCIKIGFDLSSTRVSQQKINTLSNNLCPPRTICQFGYCLPQNCSPCPRGALCLSFSQCPPGFICVGNRCERDCQNKCPIGTICFDSTFCQPIPYNILNC